MTDIYSEIKRKIRAIQGKGGPVALIAKVESTDGDTCTCSIGDLKLTDVRLRAVVNGEDSQLLVTPKKGSYVTLLDLSGGDLRQTEVIAFSEIEKIEIKTSGDIAIDCDGTITLNGGDNNGLVNIDQLKQWMQNVEADMQTLGIVLKSSPIAGNGAAAGIEFTPQTKSVASNIEDTKITH